MERGKRAKSIKNMLLFSILKFGNDFRKPWLNSKRKKKEGSLVLFSKKKGALYFFFPWPLKFWTKHVNHKMGNLRNRVLEYMMIDLEYDIFPYI